LIATKNPHIKVLDQEEQEKIVGLQKLIKTCEQNLFDTRLTDLKIYWLDKIEGFNKEMREL
jgi:hypothetical protein